MEEQNNSAFRYDINKRKLIWNSIKQASIVERVRIWTWLCRHRPEFLGGTLINVAQGSVKSLLLAP